MKGSLKVIFKSPDANQSSGSLRLELDDFLNNEKTSFNVSEKCYLMLTPSNANVIETFANVGSIKLSQKNVITSSTIKETLNFNNTSSVSLRYTPYHFLGQQIVGMTYPTGVTFELQGNQLVAMKDGSQTNAIAIVEVEYDFKYDSYFAENTSTTISDQVVMVKSAEGEVATAEIEWIAGETDVTIVVKDSCSKVNIPNALVTIGNIYTATSDEFGVAKFQDIPYGKHSLKITKNGYTDSDKDLIANDYIEVTPDE